MSKTRKLNLSIILMVVLLIGGLWALTAYFNDLPERLSQHETVVLGQNRYVPGSQAALRVVVRDSSDGAPLEGSMVSVGFRPQEGGRLVEVYSGTTDSQGVAHVAFQVPEEADAAQTLVVETKSRLGADTVERPVTLERDYRLLLASDKPIYQPGQLIHLRMLALSTFDRLPAAGGEIEVVIADGKGNKVFRKKVNTDEFGVAAVDFQLASEVNTGAYKISASMGNTASEKTVTVEHYALPKFDIELETERQYYLPGERVKGTLKANYFFGKPVAGGQVQIEGYTFDVERNLETTLQGTTDEAGNFEFELDLPAYVAGSDLEGGLGRFYIQATVTDLAKHSEAANLSLPVSGSALVIEAIPEGGQFRPGVENILYVLTSYPDGSPAEARLTINFYESGQTLEAESGQYGLAEVRLTPNSPYQQLSISASDRQGRTTQREFYFEGAYSEESVLLRPDRPVYEVGETMRLTILTSQPKGSVYLDIVREGQTVSTRAVEVSGGRAEVAVDLTPDLYGSLELHAYKILRSGAIARDTRLVAVDNADDLAISIDPSDPSGLEDPKGLTLRPGDPASLDLQVSGADGSGVKSALGLAIVDESVFALAEQDPGFAKLYFMLEQEILTPRYDLHGFSVPDLMRGLPDEDATLVSAVEDAAQASLSEVAASSFGPNMPIFSLQANSHEDAMQRASEMRARYFNSLSKALYAGLLALPLVIFGMTAYTLQRRKSLWRSLATVIVGFLFLLVLIAYWPLGESYQWARTPMERLGAFLDWLEWGDPMLFLSCLALSSLGGYLGLAALAWRRRDTLLGWSVVLLPLIVVVVIALFYAAQYASQSPDESVVLAGLLAVGLAPFALLLRSADYAWRRQALPALAALLASSFLLVGLAALAPAAAMNRQLGANLAPPVEGGEWMRGDLVVEEAIPMMAPAPTEAPAGLALDGEKSAASDERETTGAEPPRLRQYFPETMLWLPSEVTDEEGSLRVDFDVADSITTWRITALASSQDGRLGSATAGLRVFQDFFIDLDLPLALTVGDEVAVPVGVFNYLPEAQNVRLELEQADWFELMDEPIQEMEIAANDISVVYFRVRATKFGLQPFKVTAWGSQTSDAIQKEVRVYPDGKQINFTFSDRLESGTTVQQAVSIPPEAIAGTQTLLVKIYPGILSQVVEGLDSILRMPFGCFEQTSSTTYPNVLVLDYLKTTEQASPETQMKAEEYINLGYQRLTTFEVQGSGGFSLFGDAPADRMLTAYGLQEFSDMSRVHEVDPALIQRAAEWLMAQQNSDGTWENDQGLVHENTWSSLGDDRLPVTAYIAWSLVEAGFGDDPRTQNGIAYVRENQAKADDDYALALVANALVAADLDESGEISASTKAVLERLAGMATIEGNGAYWASGVATFMGSEGKTGSIETTALAALAFLRSGEHADLGNAALTYLVQQKDSFGTWYSTQATVLALKALIQSVRGGAENVDATVSVSLNGGQTQTLQVTPENFDVVQLVSFDDINPGKENLVEIQAEGEGNLMYQVTGGYYLPWDKLALYPELVEGEDLVTIDVAYDRTELAVNDTVEVQVTVTLNEAGGMAESALIDLGLPPGFSVLSEDLAALVTRYDDIPADYPYPTIERFELTGRQILIYVSNLSYGNELQFSYRLQARFPLVAQTPSSNAYDYYNPEVSGEIAPQTLTVNP